MKNIKLAIIAVLISFSIPGLAQAFDLEKLTTKTGQVYHNVKVINSDKHGLLFRHSTGICKADFHSLSDNIRELFEPAPESKSRPIHSKSRSVHSKLPTDKGGADQHASAEQDLILTIVVRRTYHPGTQNGACAHQLSQWHPTPHNWPTNYHRFDPVNLLHNPFYRAQAKLNFLQFNGLLPASCGVRGQHFGPPVVAQRFY